MFRHVAGSMSPVRFPVGHSGFSYAQVVLGYEVFCSFCVLLAAYLAWQTRPKAIGGMVWILFAYSLVGVYISWIDFSGFVLLLSAAIAICIGWATGLATANRDTRSQQGERALA
jgi:hypothetical protein